MNTSPNQRLITINKENVEKGTGTIRPYFIGYCDTIAAAAKNLNGNEFKLFIYLLTNQNGFSFGYSPKDVATQYGMSADTARNTFTKLEEKGYLTKQGGHYIFTDKPTKSLSIDCPSKETQRFRLTSSGEFVEWTFEDLVKACDGNVELAEKEWNK